MNRRTKSRIDNNKVIEPEEDTDSSKISFNPNFETDTYESIYEELIRKGDN